MKSSDGAGYDWATGLKVLRIACVRPASDLRKPCIEPLIIEEAVQDEGASGHAWYPAA